MNAEDVRVLLRQRFEDRRRYVLLEEVASTTFHFKPFDPIRRRRGRIDRIDALALAMYKSEGFGITAFEIKVSRSDWLAELRDKNKNDEWRRIATSFVYVSPVGVIKPGEVPEGRGWLLVTKGGRGLRMRIEPTVTDRDVDPGALASIVRVARRGAKATEVEHDEPGSQR